MKKTKKIILLFLLAISTPLAYLAAQENIIEGLWYCEALDKTTMKIFKSADGLWYSTIISSQNAPTVGKNILKKLSYDQKNKEYKGDLYSPSRNMTLAATLTITNDNKLKIVGKKLIISKTFYWVRV